MSDGGITPGEPGSGWSAAVPPNDRQAPTMTTVPHPERDAATKEHRLGAAALNRGNFDSARDHFERAGRLFETANDFVDAAGEYLYAGFACESHGAAHSALEWYEQALLLQRREGDPLELFSLLRRIAATAAAAGETHRRDDALAEARAIARNLGEDHR